MSGDKSPTGGASAGSRERPPVEDDGLLHNLSSTSTVISPDRRHSLTFDREGRLHLYFRQGSTFKRSLASELHLRFQDEGRQRRRLAADEALAIFAEVYDLAGGIASRADSELKARLDHEILRWTPESLAGERQRFLDCYRPISILPPDQYLSIVLQATEGCSWNRCTFCSFYMDRPFRAKSPSEFRLHAERVKRLFGAGLSLRRGIFLGDGNALALSSERLDPLIEVAKEVFPDRALYGFVDLFSGERRPVEHWVRLADSGLERVYIGMETGSDELLALVNKPGSAAELQTFVAELKHASLSVCLILMVGLGGQEHRVEHARASVEVLEGLPLDDSDLVYLSPFVEPAGSGTGPKREAMAAFTPLAEAEIEEELQRLAKMIRRLGVKTSRYDIREFIY